MAVSGADEIIADALQRTEVRAAEPVRYLDNATYRKQRTALTRAVNSGDPEKIRETVIKTVRQWNEGGYAWPDAWANWQVALNDTLPWNQIVDLADIR